MAVSAIDILLVEDDAADILLIKKAIRRTVLQLKVTVVRDGVEAMNHLRALKSSSGATRPDIVLLDLHMPRKDGHAVLAEMKADLFLHSIPVVVLTSSDDPGDIAQAARLGANACISKSHDFDLLKEHLEAIAGKEMKGKPALPARSPLAKTGRDRARHSGSQ